MADDGLKGDMNDIAVEKLVLDFCCGEQLKLKYI